jgi:hypothetical protein
MENERASWWTTLPGIVTAVAGLLSAIAALIVALNQTGMLKHQANVGQERASRTPDVSGVPPTTSYHFRKYTNAKFGYSISYPEGLFVPIPSESSDDGQTFRSPDKRALLRVLGRYIDPATTIERMFQADQKSGAEHNRQITYRVQRQNWFVISGLEGNKIFYQKSILTGNSVANMFVLYDETLNTIFDPIVDRVSRSFTR